MHIHFEEKDQRKKWVSSLLNKYNFIMKNILLIVSIVLMGISLSCKKNENPVLSTVQPPIVPDTSSNLLPLNIGNEWIYKTTFLDSMQNIQSVQYDTFKVAADTILSNEAWYVTDFGYLKEKTDGLWSWIGYPKLLYKYPAKIGDTIQTTDAINKIISTNENYTVPYGTLPCYHYQLLYINDNGYIQDYYFYPGIGFIKFETGTETQITHKWYTGVRYELVSFELK